VPQAARILANLWRPGIIQACVKQRAGAARVIELADGVLHGKVLAGPSFAPRLQENLAPAVEDGLKGAVAMLVAYADGVVLEAAPAEAPGVLACLDARLRGAGLERDASKVAAWVPAWGADPGTPEADGLKAVAPLRFNGLPLLGSAAAAELELALRPFGLASQPARERYGKAVQLAEACAELAEAHVPMGGRQAAWTLLRRVACHALDFDARAHPPDQFLVHAQRLDEAVVHAAARIAGAPGGLPPEAVQQLQLPADLGGLGLQSAAVRAECSLAAADMQCAQGVDAALTRWRRRAVDDEAAAGLGAGPNANAEGASGNGAGATPRSLVHAGSGCLAGGCGPGPG